MPGPLAPLRFRPGLPASLLLLLGLPLFVWLGLWQLDRAEQRSARQSLLEQQATAPAQPLASLQEPFEARQRVRLDGRFDADHSFILDNRSRDGQVGAELLQPFFDIPSGRWVLLNRGWQAWPDRHLPLPMDTPRERLRLTAWVAHPQAQPFRLPPPSSGEWPLRLQHIEMEAVWALLERDGVGYELRLEAGPAAYRVDWPGSAMTVGRHLGYAFQWFALAAAVLGLWLYVGLRPAGSEPPRPPPRPASEPRTPG
ncbi:SURF1 family protein [Stutzerimonas tarimensis]|uniref:SURF1-like protein n=1 Tax=Stutzerimonas tarimensis TaxID=1507735 RepID=A0ABV7T902_9GAMM